MGDRALGKTRCALIQRQDVGVAVPVQTSGSLRVVPGPGGEDDDSGPDPVGDTDTGQARPAIVEHPHHVTIFDSPVGGVLRVDGYGLPALHFACHADGARIVLTVQPGGWLIRDQVEWETFLALRAEPLRRLQPDRVPRAVVVPEAIDSLGEDLDLARRRR